MPSGETARPNGKPLIVIHNLLFTLMGAGEDFSRPSGTTKVNRIMGKTIIWWLT